MSAETGNMQDVYPLGSEKPDGPAAFLAMLQRLAQNRGAGIGAAADAAALTTLFADIDFNGFIVEQLDTLQLWQRKAGATIPLTTNMRRQLDTTNDTVALNQQAGIGMIAGAAATAITEAVTFPTAFKAATFPIVICQFAGVVAGAFNPAGAGNATGVAAKATAVGPTGFTANIERDTNMSAGVNYYYSWVAFGEPA